MIYPTSLSVPCLIGSCGILRGRARRRWANDITACLSVVPGLLLDVCCHHHHRLLLLLLMMMMISVPVSLKLRPTIGRPCSSPLRQMLAPIVVQVGQGLVKGAVGGGAGAERVEEGAHFAGQRGARPVESNDFDGPAPEDTRKFSRVFSGPAAEQKF